MSVETNDPLFQYQWFLNNTGQSGGAVGSDIRVLPIWPDYTGDGIKVAIVDDGVQMNHPDLFDNIDPDASWDVVKGAAGGDPVNKADKHGTAVAGLVAEVADNGIGGKGVAYGATLQVYRISLDQSVMVQHAAIAFQKALENDADVVSSSWGIDKAFGVNRQDPARADFFSALDALAGAGRDGKGTIVVFANGNEGARKFDGNLDNILNDRHVIGVGALDDTGVRSAYSTPGANLLISAPGGASTIQNVGQPGNGVLTTDRTSVEGYNEQFGEPGDYAYNFNGTSAATPIVSGIVALMLEANPDLGYRDVQEILARSAQFVDPAARSWITTKSTTWNGGGAMFSPDYGFGEVDAHAAVRLAEAYEYLHVVPADDRNVKTATKASDIEPIAIEGNKEKDVDFKTISFVIEVTDVLDLNHIDLKLNAKFVNPSEIFVDLTSPTGTQVTLIDTPQNALVVESLGNPEISAIPWPAKGFAMGTDVFWGETSKGTWTVTVGVVNFGTGGTVEGATLSVYGDEPSAEKEFVYTDDFEAVMARDSWQQNPPSRTGIKVAEGQTAVIDAVALSSDVLVNLTARHAEIQGQSITIDPATKVTKLFTGDGNDTLVGDAGDNFLLAGRGHNTLDGGAGVDSALYIGSRADYTANYSSNGRFTAETLSGNLFDVAVRIERATFTEGTLYVQAAGDTSLGIAALYNGLLFRDADGGGYRYWTNGAAAGAGLSTIGASFLESSEYANGAGKLDDQTFLADVYQNMLHRPIDAGGAAYWNSELASGSITRAGVVLSINLSVEYQTTQLTGVFSDINSLGNLWG